MAVVLVASCIMGWLSSCCSVRLWSQEDANPRCEANELLSTCSLVRARCREEKYASQSHNCLHEMCAGTCSVCDRSFQRMHMVTKEWKSASLGNGQRQLVMGGEDRRRRR